MDNKTHMMFHDQDIREETTDKLVNAFNFISKAKTAGDSDEQIATELRDKYQLDDSTIKKLLS